MRVWPQLAEWISADRAGLRARQQLFEAAETWESTDRDPAVLYRRIRLTIARDWAAGPRRKARLSKLEDVYLVKNIDQKQREQKVERGSASRPHQFLAGLAAFAVIAAVGFLFVFAKWSTAVQQHSLMIPHINVVAVSPDSRTPVDDSTDQAMQYYDISNPEAPIFRDSITGHTGAVKMVAFTADNPNPPPDGNAQTGR